jgi:alpha-tubulin suppressor-like RCC1 family protein
MPIKAPWMRTATNPMNAQELCFSVSAALCIAGAAACGSIAGQVAPGDDAGSADSSPAEEGGAQDSAPDAVVRDALGEAEASDASLSEDVTDDSAEASDATPSEDAADGVAEAPDAAPSEDAADGAAANPSVVSVGNGTACAVTAGGSVKCWGNLAIGQSTNTPPSPVAVPVPGLTSGATAVSVGWWNACAVADGAVKCWGSSFALGNAQYPMGSPVPVQVAGLTTGVRAVSVGRVHACALTGEGGVVCWGMGMHGALGDGLGPVDTQVPVPVTGLASGVTALSAGDDTTCAVTVGGRIECWGRGDVGELGVGLDGGAYASGVPVEISSLTSAAMAVSTSRRFSCAILAGGAAWWWGSTPGLASPEAGADHFVPVPVPNLTSTAIGVSAGLHHACAVTAGGGVTCWGDNQYGALGDNSMNDSPAPVQVTGLGSGVTAVSAGFNATCAMTQAGGVVCWGTGPLGNGRTSSLVPVPVAGFP